MARDWQHIAPVGSAAVLPMHGHLAKRSRGGAATAPSSSIVITSVPCRVALGTTSYVPSPRYETACRVSPCCAVKRRPSVALGRPCATGNSSASHAVKGTRLSVPTTSSASERRSSTHGSLGSMRPHAALAVWAETSKLTGTCNVIHPSRCQQNQVRPPAKRVTPK